MHCNTWRLALFNRTNRNTENAPFLEETNIFFLDIRRIIFGGGLACLWSGFSNTNACVWVEVRIRCRLCPIIRRHHILPIAFCGPDAVGLFRHAHSQAVMRLFKRRSV